MKVWSVKQIVDWMIVTGSGNTSSGNWHIDFDEIYNRFPGVTKEWVYDHIREICEEIDSREEIISETWLDEKDGEWIGFDMNFCLAYCPNVEDDEED